jgi:hypothetical protein
MQRVPLMDNNLLNDRIGQLKDWKQTESLSEILYNTLHTLNTYTKDRFDELAQEIKDEYALHSGAPPIRIAVCTEGNVDKQLFMHPVAPPPVNNPNYIATVFVECDYHTILKLMRQTYTARVSGKAGTIPMQVELKYSTRYLRKLEALYYAFSENELPWATVNGRYFYKFLDVCSKSKLNQDVEGFEIDFAQYGKYISYDKVLLWNIAALTVPVAECIPKPAYNIVKYEHMLKNLKPDENKYLVCPMGDKFDFFRRGKEMYVRTDVKQLEQINLLRVISNEDTDSKLYLQAKTNAKKPGLINSMAKGKYTPTRGEAERIVTELGEAAYMRLADIKILPNTEENYSHYKGIDYNSFREDNMVDKDRKLLLFTFNTNIDKLWAYETMFYIVSELQLYYYEYQCVGELN